MVPVDAQSSVFALPPRPFDGGSESTRLVIVTALPSPCFTAFMLKVRTDVQVRSPTDPFGQRHTTSVLPALASFDWTTPPVASEIAMSNPRAISFAEARRTTSTGRSVVVNCFGASCAGGGGTEHPASKRTTNVEGMRIFMFR